MKLIFVLLLYTHVYSGEQVVRIGVYEHHEQCEQQGQALVDGDSRGDSLAYRCVPANG